MFSGVFRGATITQKTNRFYPQFSPRSPLVVTPGGQVVSSLKVPPRETAQVPRETIGEDAAERIERETPSQPATARD